MGNTLQSLKICLQHWQFTVLPANSIWHRLPTILSCCSRIGKKIANLSSDCVPRILLDSRMWKHLAQSKKKQQISKKNIETSNKWFPSLQRNILPEESLIEALNMFNNCPAKQYRHEMKIHASTHIFLSPSTVCNPARIQIIPHYSISNTVYQRKVRIQPLRDISSVLMTAHLDKEKQYWAGQEVWNTSNSLYH